MALAQIQGPSSSQTPYLVPSAAGVKTVAILTVGDSVNNKPGSNDPYRLVGIPDGTGALDNGDGTFSFFVNHEISATQGFTRRHGGTGAFVSRWKVRKDDFTVLNGEDQVKFFFAPSAGAKNFGRLCSADLPPTEAFFNAATGLGTQFPIFMNGEEIGAEGRAFAHVVGGPANGFSYYLPKLGRFSWENSLASPSSGDTTFVVGLDDTTPGQVYVYLGRKTDRGGPHQRAGLANGLLYGIKVPGAALESRTTGIGGATTFTLEPMGDQAGKSGAQLQAESVAQGVTEWLRPEDGAWDTINPNRFYFVTTDRFDQTKNGTGAQIGRSRLWRLTFDSLTNPTGGTVELLLDGTEAMQMMDNLCIDRKGNLVIQEDVGNQSHSSKIWYYEPVTDTLTLVAQHDPARFGDLGVPPTAPFTADEESSGVIDASAILGPGWFLLDVQAHYNIGDPELVEGGQINAIFIPAAATPSQP